MKVLLLYPEVGIGIRWSELLQVGTIGAMVRQAHHKLSLIHCKHPSQLSAIGQFTQRFEPDVVISSVAWDQWAHAVPLLKGVRSAAPKALMIVSGVYPTLDPDSVVQQPEVDAVLVGECEVALEDILKRLAMRQNITDTPNFWFKSRESGLRKNALRPLMADLDVLPFTERTLYDHAALVQATGGGFPMLASRGCPHNCQFCYVPRLKAVSHGKGTFLRPRGALSLCAEVQQWARQEQIQWVDFVDEYFPQNIEWIGQFCGAWKVQTRLPFRFTAVAESLTPETLAMLREAGCEGIRLGIETGDEKFRARIADRNLSNQRLKSICEECRRLGIQVTLTSQVGLPLENPDLAWATVALNEALDPDAIEPSIYQPIPGTALHQLCTEHGFIKPTAEAPALWTSRNTPLKLPSISEEQVLNTYDELIALQKRLRLKRAQPLGEGVIDLARVADSAAVESSVERALDVGEWSREGDQRFCLFQAAGSRVVFDIELPEDSALEFGLAQGPFPFGIRFPRSVQVEIRLRQGENDDVLFALAVEMSSRKSRRGWFDTRLPMVEWPAGPAQLIFTATPLGTVPVAPVYVAWARPRISRGAPAAAEASTGQSSKKVLLLEQQIETLRKESEELHAQLASTREELDNRRQRVGELHLKVIELEKELETLREEKFEWQRQREEMERSKLKRLFRKE